MDSCLSQLSQESGSVLAVFFTSSNLSITQTVPIARKTKRVRSLRTKARKRLKGRRLAVSWQVSGEVAQSLPITSQNNSRRAKSTTIRTI